MVIKFIDFESRTKGRQRIVDLRLDKESIAKRIIEIYQKVLMCE